MPFYSATLRQCFAEPVTIAAACFEFYLISASGSLWVNNTSESVAKMNNVKSTEQQNL